MKKIVTLGAIAVLAAGFMFADEPAADVSVTEFSGNAKVTWGMDLDAGKTGFKNTEEANFKVKLFAGGNKVTEGDGLWAELKIKTDGLKLENGEWKDGKASVDAAKIHFNDFFIGIRSGDVQVGAYKFDGAIRSADSDHAKWIKDVGAENFKYGIDAGIDNTNLNVTLNFRSYVNPNKLKYNKDEVEDTQYTNAYAISLEGGLKDSNEFVPGLFVNAGFSYNLSGEWYGYGDRWQQTWYGTKTATYYEMDRHWFGGTGYQNGHQLAYSFNAGYKLAIDDTYFVKPAVAFAGSLDSAEKNIPNKDGGERWFKDSKNKNDVAFGVIFGWGANADANAGVPFLDGDYAKKVTPGVSVIVDIPLVETSKNNEAGWGAASDTISVYNYKQHNKVIAFIVPSVYTGGELVEGLSAGLYSEMALLNYKQGTNDRTKDGYQSTYVKPTDDSNERPADKPRTFETWDNAALKQEKFAFALAGGIKYAYNADITVTPYAGFRFVNRAYVENKIASNNPLNSDPVFTDLGVQDEMRTDSAQYYNTNEHLAGGFFNLKAGVEIGGLINNTTFSVEYVSANLLNKTDYTSKEISWAEYGRSGTKANPKYKPSWPDGKRFNNKWYNVKLGHFDIGCKIAL